MSRDKRDLMAQVDLEVRAFHNAVEAVTQAAAERLGLNQTDHRCLDILARHERMTPSQLAEVSGLTTGAVTTVIDRMEQAGYVRRVRDAVDRRRILLEIPPEARKRADALYSDLGRAGAMILSTYSDEELELIIDFLRQARELNTEYAARMRQPPDAE